MSLSKVSADICSLNSNSAQSNIQILDKNFLLFTNLLENLLHEVTPTLEMCSMLISYCEIKKKITKIFYIKVKSVVKFKNHLANFA